MLQFAGSDVGKSRTTAALCGLARLVVIITSPFNSRNISSNPTACAISGQEHQSSIQLEKRSSIVVFNNIRNGHIFEKNS